MRENVIAAVVAATILTLVIIFHPGYNYPGTGNEFTIETTVTAAGAESVKVNQVDVKQANGKAVGWFDQESGWFDQNFLEVHDNYVPGIFSGKEHIGQVYAANGSPMACSELKAGQRLRLTGKIRTSRYNNSHIDRAVFDRADIIG